MTLLRRTFAACIFASLIGACCPLCPLDRAITTRPAATTTPFINAHALIIVRHADINIADKKSAGSNAHLTPRGEVRAKELAFALKNAGITRLITSDTLRTQETAAALADELHLSLEKPFSHGAGGPTSPSAAPTPLPPAAYTSSKKKEAADVFAYLVQTAKPTDTILLIHHHSVLPGLLELITAHAEPPFNEPTEFDRLYVILPNPGTHTYQILRLRYGGDWGTEQ